MTLSREERLSAYLDGELPPEEALAFEQELERDPELARELERLMTSDAQLRAAIDEAIPDTADDATLNRLGLGGRPQPAKALPVAANDRGPSRWWLPAGVGIAASAAALMLLLPSSPSKPWESQDFSKALDSTPSLQTASFEQNSVVPRLTFVAGDGRYCREFQLRSSNSEWDRDGIACRSDGRWSPEVLAPAAATPSNGGSIDLAGGGGNPALDAVYDRLGGSSPLDSAEESRAIGSRWTDPRK